MDNLNVTIPLERYEELLDIETRVNVVLDLLKHETVLKTKDILFILGTSLAIDLAEELEKEENELWEKIRRNAE